MPAIHPTETLLVTTTQFTYHYALYGLRIASNRPRTDDRTDDRTVDPAAPRKTPSHEQPVDMTVDFVGDRPHLTAQADMDWSILRTRIAADATMQISVATTPRGLAHRLCLRNDLEYLAVTALPDAQGKPSRVEVHWHNTQQSADEHGYNMASWVFDVALSYMMRLRIPANLHGGAVGMAGKAVAFVGEKGMGKSTLTAALIGAGYPMLTDDHVALWPRDHQGGNQRGSGFWVEPGAPRLRLWPASLPVLAMQHDEAEDLPSVYTFIEKRIKHLRLPTAAQPGEFQPEALPLGAIYLLQPRDPARAAPAIEPLPAKAALHELWTRRYSPISVSPEHAAAELAVLAQVAQQTRICYLHRPDGLETLPQVIAAMRADVGAPVDS